MRQHNFLTLKQTCQLLQVHQTDVLFTHLGIQSEIGCALSNAPQTLLMLLAVGQQQELVKDMVLGMI
jgi:hypothetical protein